MYLWTAIDVDEQLADVKKEAKKIEKVVDFTDSNITLPMHISLKISCPIAEEQYEEAVREVMTILKKPGPFEVRTKGIELHDTICWLAMEENTCLRKLHEELDRLFLEKFNVPRHRYDLDFQFHSTLFLDRDSKKVKEAFLRIKDIQIPPVLEVKNFLIGMSPEGKIGTYRVIKQIQ